MQITVRVLLVIVRSECYADIGPQGEKNCLVCSWMHLDLYNLDFGTLEDIFDKILEWQIGFHQQYIDDNVS